MPVLKNKDDAKGENIENEAASEPRNASYRIDGNVGVGGAAAEAAEGGGGGVGGSGGGAGPGRWQLSVIS